MCTTGTRMLRHALPHVSAALAMMANAALVALAMCTVQTNGQTGTIQDVEHIVVCVYLKKQKKKNLPVRHMHRHETASHKKMSFLAETRTVVSTTCV